MKATVKWTESKWGKRVQT